MTARRALYPICRPCLSNDHTDCRGDVPDPQGASNACGCDNDTCLGFGTSTPGSRYVRGDRTGRKRCPSCRRFQ